MSKQKETLIVKKYAEALASQANSEAVMNDLLLIKESFNSSEEFKNFLLRPGIKADDKIKIIDNIFSGKIDTLSLNTLKLLIKKRRISIAPELYEAYKECFYKNSNIELAMVYTASEISEENLKAIKSSLEKIFKKDVQISSQLDEELIAGSKIKLSGKVIDSSLKSKINKMKQLIA